MPFFWNFAKHFGNDYDNVGNASSNDNDSGYNTVWMQLVLVLNVISHEDHEYSANTFVELKLESISLAHIPKKTQENEM